MAERKGNRRGTVGADVLEAGDGALDRRDRSLGDPPQAQGRLGRRLDDLPFTKEALVNGDISMAKNGRGQYEYSAVYSDNNFRITATYMGVPASGVPHSLNIDENMNLREGP